VAEESQGNSLKSRSSAAAAAAAADAKLIRSKWMPPLGYDYLSTISRSFACPCELVVTTLTASVSSYVSFNLQIAGCYFCGQV